METTQKITVETTVNAPVEKVWQFWTAPEHIVNWNFASDDWHCPKAENDLKTGGNFSATMAAKDGSMSFDFGGVYNEVQERKQIKYTMEDGRQVEIQFTEQGDKTTVTETFDADASHSADMQKAGWQAILDNFKKYTEGNLS